MTLLDTAPDCARCNHPATAHPDLDGTSGDCTGDPRNPCPCSAYSPAAADPDCSTCEGTGLVECSTPWCSDPDDAETCGTCGGTGAVPS